MRSTMGLTRRMTNESDPFNGFDLQEAIDLRWTLGTSRLNAGNCLLSTYRTWKS
jgi:hypothetical protein